MRSPAAEAEREAAPILIIDDDEMIAVALYRHLATRGNTVDLAVDARSAAALLSAKRYSIVIMDAYLTGHLHGRPSEFVSAVRDLGGDAHVVVLTAYRTRALAEALAACPRTTIVEKPQSISFLTELVDGLLVS